MKNIELFKAIENDDQSKLELLVKSGIELTQTDEYGRSPAKLAVILGNISIAKYLINAGANIDFLNEFVLGGAIDYQRIEVILFLIEMGIDIDMKFKEDNERTALMESVHTGDLRIVKMIVEAGADVNAISRKSEYALMNAASHGFHSIYDYLAPLTSPELRKWAERMLNNQLG